LTASNGAANRCSVVSEGKIRIGIGGWTYEPWRGVFYPSDLPQKRELEYASRQLSAIEINGTFYSRQSPKSWETWAATVPDDFQFTIKASRFCVTRPKLADAGEGIGNFFAQGLTALGPKLGPTLWMLAKFRKFDREDIAGFLKLLPDQAGQNIGCTASRIADDKANRPRRIIHGQRRADRNESGCSKSRKAKRNQTDRGAT